MEKQRIKAIEPPYPESVQKDFDTIMPAGMPPLNVFLTVANNPRVLHRFIIGGLLDRGSISIQDREIVILRACGICKAEYEWGVHVAGFSAKAEINQNQIDNTYKETIDQSLWNDKQLCILSLVDQLHETQTCDDELWRKLREHYQDDQLIELVMLAGLYHAVSFIVNSLRIEKESFAPGFKSS
ncbi:carboxymuconolactone decarboxylase family protein [bacterium]|nr:carboxymuconolactone decarboxylase family protein [bacterium]